MRKLFIVFVLWAVLLTSCTAEETSQAPTAVLPSRTMVSSTMDMTEIWRVRTGPPNYPSPAGQTPPFFYVTQNKIVMSTTIEDGSNDSYLNTFSMDTGTTIWQTRYQNSNGARSAAAYLDNASNRLYLEYGFHVGAFDLGTGQQLWMTKELRDHESYVFPSHLTVCS